MLRWIVGAVLPPHATCESTYRIADQRRIAMMLEHCNTCIRDLNDLDLFDPKIRPHMVELTAEELAKRFYTSNDRHGNLHVRQHGRFNQRYALMSLASGRFRGPSCLSRQIPLYSHRLIRSRVNCPNQPTSSLRRGSGFGMTRRSRQYLIAQTAGLAAILRSREVAVTAATRWAEVLQKLWRMIFAAGT